MVQFLYYQFNIRNMSETPDNTTGNRPSHVLVQYRGEGDSRRPSNVGAAWPNKDGTGFNLRIEDFHGDIKLNMVPNTEKE